MKRLAKNLILFALAFSAIFAADLSTTSDDREKFLNCRANNVEKNFLYNSEGNSEFWSKFRESVMPDDNNGKGKIPNYEKNPPPPPPDKRPSRNKAM